MWVFSEPAWDFEFYDAEEGFGEDAAWHFWCAFDAVDEYDRYFFDCEATFVGCEFHFDLECVAFEADFVEFDSLEHLTAVAFEASSGVGNREACHATYVFRGIVAHEYATHWPVDYVDNIAYIARTYGYVGTLVGASIVEFE